MLLEDCVMEAFPTFLEGPAPRFVGPEEPSSPALGAFPRQFQRMHRWEALLGLALSIGLHASFLLAAILFAQTLPPPPPEPHFVLVSLEEAGPGGFGGAGYGEEGLGEQGEAQGLSSGQPAASALDTEQPAVPEPAGDAAQPPLFEEERPAPPEPVVTKWSLPQQPTRVSKSSKPITRQPARKAEPKPEKQKEAPPVAAAAPRTRAQAEPQDLSGNQTGKDAGQTPSGPPGAADAVGSGAGEGAGTTIGKGGSHHGPGTGAAEFTVKQVDRPPAVVRKVEPTFPDAARKMGLTGKVVAKLLVAANGRVSRVSILEATPPGIFEQDVLKALKQWEFKPGYYKNQAVATWVVLPVSFRLSP